MGDQSDQSKKVQRLIGIHVGWVYTLAIKYAPSPDVAEDVAQQVFLEFLKKQHTWDLDSDVRPLLAEITRLVAKRFWQERCRQMAPEVQALAEHVRMLAEEREFSPIRDEEKDALTRCLEKLPDKSKHLIRTRYYLGANSSEIAGKLDMTPGAVRRALFRLRTKLRQCVHKQLGSMYGQI